jgi:ribosomal protein S18 acetylase RimI-like enzyme
MKIERINKEDYQLLETFLASCGSSLDTFRYFRSRPLSVIQNHLTTLLAIDEAQVPIAYGHLDPEDGMVWLGICVSDKNQGKGYGNLMMRAIMDEALRLKISEINLTVDKVNLQAAHLYEKYGFKIIKELETIFWYHWSRLDN